MNSQDIRIEIRRKGMLMVISGPSGVGKNTIKDGIFKQIKNDLRFSVSYTTRPIRKNEKDGRDYHFTNREKFFELMKYDKFVEWAEVHQNFYGTTREEIEKCFSGGYDLLMDVDVKGSNRIKSLYPEAITLFIMPPSLHALEDRLRKRGIDDIDLRIRLVQAEKEISEAKNYDYIIINDEIEDSITNAVAILKAERCRNSRIEIMFKKGV